jgi:hypothetical protein
LAAATVPATPLAAIATATTATALATITLTIPSPAAPARKSGELLSQLTRFPSLLPNTLIVLQQLNDVF